MDFQIPTQEVRTIEKIFCQKQRDRLLHIFGDAVHIALAYKKGKIYLAV